VDSETKPRVLWAKLCPHSTLSSCVEALTLIVAVLGKKEIIKVKRGNQVGVLIPLDLCPYERIHQRPPVPLAL
jgi:hypothetical protein